MMLEFNFDYSSFPSLLSKTPTWLSRYFSLHWPRWKRTSTARVARAHLQRQHSKKL